MPDTSEPRLYKIGEVCRLADVQPYVLRYWETEFRALAPNKSGGGQRLYAQHEIDIILRIKQLLYSEGFTIAGAKKKLEQEQADPLPASLHTSPGTAPATASRPDLTKTALRNVKSELAAILKMLEQ